MQITNYILALILLPIFIGCSTTEPQEKVTLDCGEYYQLVKIDEHHIERSSTTKTALIPAGLHELKFKYSSKEPRPNHYPALTNISHTFKSGKTYGLYFIGSSSYERDKPWVDLLILEEYNKYEPTRALTLP